MAIGTSENDDLVSDINVTPLVDVMLVLLVVFIVTAPLLTHAVKVTLPQTSLNAPTEQKPSVTLSVDAKGRVFLDKTEYALAGIEPELRRRKAENADVAVHLSADQDSHYGTVAKVMASASRAGVTKLSVLSTHE